MVQVVTAGAGSVWLLAGKETWWGWKITYGDVWTFWANVVGTGEDDKTIEITRVRSRRLGDKNYAILNLKNVGSQDALFVMYVARIF